MTLEGMWYPHLLCKRSPSAASKLFCPLLLYLETQATSRFEPLRSVVDDENFLTIEVSCPYLAGKEHPVCSCFIT